MIDNLYIRPFLFLFFCSNILGHVKQLAMLTTWLMTAKITITKNNVIFITQGLKYLNICPNCLKFWLRLFYYTFHLLLYLLYRSPHALARILKMCVVIFEYKRKCINKKSPNQNFIENDNELLGLKPGLTNIT